MFVRRCFTAATFVLSFSIAGSGHAGGMPDDVKKQIDDHLIGSWELTTKFDGKVEKSHSVFQWANGKESFIEQGTNLDPAYTFTQVGGWDPASSSVKIYAFTSRGDHGHATYDKLTNEKWTGHGQGVWEDKEWKSAITLEWTDQGFRYEDVTEGKPFVVIGKRLKKSASESSLKSFAKFMEGTWTREDDGFVKEHVYSWTANGKFLHSDGSKDPMPWDGMIGIDESNGKVGWWGFMPDGATGAVHLANVSNDSWIFEGVDYGPDGPVHRQVIVTKLADDQLNGKVTDTIDGVKTIQFDEVWKRK